MTSVFSSMRAGLKRLFCLGLASLMGMAAGHGIAYAQKPGGTLRVQLMDTPPSASPLEEITVSVVVPFMGVFNNLVI